MSEMNIKPEAMAEITMAVKNLLYVAKRNGADLYFAFGGGGKQENIGLYAVPSGKWKRINAMLANDDEYGNSLVPSQGFSKVPVDIEFLDESDESLLDLDP